MKSKPPKPAPAPDSIAAKLYREKSRDELAEQNESMILSQLELETSRDRYAELFDSAPICFVNLTHSGLVHEVNLPATKLLGHGRSRLVGWPFVGLLAPGDKTKFLEHLSRCRQHPDPTRPQSVELKLLRTVGDEPVFIELVSLPEESRHSPEISFKCVFRDITEIRQIREEHRWQAAIVESSEDAIIGKDLTGKIVSCNHGALELYGYTHEELIGQSMLVLLPSELHREEAVILQRIRRGERIEHFETVRRRKDGSLVSVSLTISSIHNAQGRIIGASNTARDISQRIENEKKLEESLARERTARETAEAASRAKDDFLAALSHELRTPLNPVLLVASNAAADPDLPARARADFESICKNVELEARLIDDLLDMTRITRGKLVLNRADLDAHTALNDAVAIVKPDIEKKHLTLNMHLWAVRSEVSGEAVRLQQVFWNVLKNAVKFTPAGGKITVETQNLSDNRLEVRITDTGIGMNPDEIGHVFDAFSQGTHRFGGLGLGLAISRALVELHSGRIRAESKGKSRGASFCIELPLVQDVRKAETPVAHPVLSAPLRPFAEKRPSEQRVRVLLVEDHAPTRAALTRLLIHRRYDVTSAASVSEARSALGQNSKRFQILISDIGLPDGNGCDLMQEMREQPGLKGIALTGYGMEQDVARTEAAGFAAHLTKPVRIESLDNALAAALAEK